MNDFFVRTSYILLSALLVAPSLPTPVVGYQSPAPAAPSSAVTLQSALTALSPTPTTDVSLSGSVHSIAGSDDNTGTATLKALSSGSARVDMAFTSGTVSEIYSSSTSGIAAAWVDATGKSHQVPGHNLLAEPAWFSPVVSLSRRLNSGQVVTDIGADERFGIKVEHFSVYEVPNFPQPAVGVTYQHLSQLDYFLDPATSLPVSISYNIHPDSNAGQDIPVAVEFSDYHAVSGVQIPFHIQKFINGTLALDIQLQNAVVNSGISISAFAIQ